MTNYYDSPMLDTLKETPTDYLFGCVMLGAAPASTAHLTRCIVVLLLR
jgi:hypothetical protein